jgi:hypothetical protein
MKHLLAIVCFLLLSNSFQAQEHVVPVLSGEAEISLLTCSPGEETYSLFGHSAMRVHDPVLDIDAVFNYGTFSFDESFYFNFVMGKLNYKLGLSGMERFSRAYEQDGRGIIEQKLNLDSAQTQAIFEFLDWNYKPANRYYLYDFFNDNCSSILRDVLDTVLQGQVTFADLTKPNQPSYRNMIDSYLIYDPWGDFGIDLGLGLPCDRSPDYLEYMFLPDELSAAYDHATIYGKPLVTEKSVLIEPVGLTYKWSLTDPIPLFWVLFGIVAILSAIGYRKRKAFIGIDVVLFSVIGLVGALLFFLWFITDHTATNNNFNMLWAWPIHLIMLPFLWNKRVSSIYFSAYGVVLILTLALFPFLPQMLHLATIPIMAALLCRSLLHWTLNRRASEM